MSDGQEIQTYEDAIEEGNIEEHKGGHEGGQVADEVEGPGAEDLTEAAERIESVLTPSPDELSRLKPPQDEKPTIPGIPSPGRVQFPELPEELRNIFETDLSTAGQLELLRVIAAATRESVNLLRFAADVQIRQLNAQIGTWKSVEPLTQITVSGSNEIDNGDTAEEVVPNSEDSDIPTRTLFLAADEDNQREIAFGDDNTSPESGFILSPGEAIVLSFNLNQQVLYMAAEEAGQKVNLLGMV